MLLVLVIDQSDEVRGSCTASFILLLVSILIIKLFWAQFEETSVLFWGSAAGEAMRDF